MLRKCTFLILSSAMVCSVAVVDINAATKTNTYAIKNTVQYENPITKVIEDVRLKVIDKKYQETKKQGLEKIKTILGSYSLIEEKNGKKYLTIRIGNTDTNQNYKLSVKSAKDKAFKNVKYTVVKTDKANKTVDLKVEIASLDTIVRVSADVNGKNMIFFTKLTKVKNLTVKSFSNQKINVVKTAQAINKSTTATKKEEIKKEIKVEEKTNSVPVETKKTEEVKKEVVKDEKIDIENLQDGTYKVQVEMFKANGDEEPSEKSMANDALEKTAIVTVKDKKATITINMQGMALSGFGDKKGHLTSAWYYETKEDYLEKLRNPQDVSRIKATSYSKLYEDVDFMTDEKREFPKNVIFPVKIGERYSYIKVDIDAMPSAKPDAALYINWNTISR